MAEHAALSHLPLQNAPYGTPGDQGAFAGKRPVLPIGVPVLYPGTPGEIIDAHDVVALATLLKSMAEGER